MKDLLKVTLCIMAVVCVIGLLGYVINMAIAADQVKADATVPVILDADIELMMQCVQAAQNIFVDGRYTFHDEYTVAVVAAELFRATKER